MAEYQLNWKGRQVFQEIQGISKEALKQLAQTTTEVAKRLTPYKTGTNRRSITWDEENGVFRVYTQSGYGGFLEIGTTRMPPRQYIQPAFETASKELQQNLNKQGRF